MQVVIPHSVEDKPTLSDVITRLGVLYPNLEITKSDGVLTISGVEPSHAESVKQTALDQLIRSRFDARSVSLRENLYKKLLG